MRISSILLFQTIFGSSQQLMFCAPSPPAITMLIVQSFRPNILLSGYSNNQFPKVAPYDFLRV